MTSFHLSPTTHRVLGCPDCLHSIWSPKLNGKLGCDCRGRVWQEAPGGVRFAIVQSWWGRLWRREPRTVVATWLSRTGRIGDDHQTVA